MSNSFSIGHSTNLTIYISKLSLGPDYFYPFVVYCPENSHHATTTLQNFAGMLAGTSDLHVFTHCPDIINYTGYLIGEDILDASNVRVVTIREDATRSYALFNDEGYLNENWEFGFFTPDYDEVAVRG